MYRETVKTGKLYDPKYVNARNDMDNFFKNQSPLFEDDYRKDKSNLRHEYEISVYNVDGISAIMIFDSEFKRSLTDSHNFSGGTVEVRLEANKPVGELADLITEVLGKTGKVTHAV